MSEPTEAPLGRKARAQHLRIAKDSNDKTRNAVSAYVIGAGGIEKGKKAPTYLEKKESEGVEKEGAAAGESRAIPNPWEYIRTTTYNFEMVVEPPFEPLGLALLTEQNSELNQCIEAMEQNIVGYGYRLKPLVDVDVAKEKDPVMAEAILNEWERFDAFLTYADYDECSFTNLRKRTRRDLELTGNAYWEVIRDDGGAISAFNHIPSYMMRLRLLEQEVSIVTRRRAIGRGSRRRFKDQRIRKRFRSFVQARYTGIGMNEPQVVHFREYGDPRPRSWKTGEKLPATAGIGTGEGEIPPTELATEVIHFKLYSPRSPYGVPRYIGNLLAIFGSRAAEEINYTTFKNNNIPSMAILVSNGMLTEGSITRITQFVESAIQGSDNYSKFVVIEAEGLMEGTDPTVPKMELKPLTDSQHNDALFQQYDKNNNDKTRRAFRLPPIFVGRSDDYTTATADTSIRIADEQVFDPERKEDDHVVNRVLMDMGMIYHAFETNSPNITNDQNLIAVLTGAEKAGGTTPRIARMILEDILGRDLGGFDPTINPDIPFSLQMADAVKNKALPNEPGQQLTALKTMLGIDPDSTLSAALDLVGLEKSASKQDEVVINVGSQAMAIVDGSVPALLHPVAFALAGRDLLVGDGFEALGKVSFGSTQRMEIDQAAKAVGLEASDVRSMFPGLGEVWVSTVQMAESIRPMAYTQPDDSYFAHLRRQ
jgi:PBSX family phage portal protein